MHTRRMTPFASDKEAALVQQLAAQVRAKRITQAELAKAVGISREAVSAYFNGKRSIPLPVLLAACEQVGVELGTLVRMAEAQVGEQF